MELGEKSTTIILLNHYNTFWIFFFMLTDSSHLFVTYGDHQETPQMNKNAYGNH